METNQSIKAAEKFRQKMESFAPISEADFQPLTEVMQEKHFNKGEVLLKEGQVCRTFYFICSGYIRSFSLDRGREVNVKFYFENDIACDFTSFRSEEPSEFYLVAMEDLHVYCATKTEAIPVFESGVSWTAVLFRFFQHLFLKEEAHANTFKLLSPEERYQYMLDNRSEYLQRIPLVYLASYLGVSRETLTRIRKKKS